MKVIHVISSLEVGGAQRLLSDLLPIQKRHGMDVSLLVYNNVDNAFTQKIKDANIPIISLDTENYRDLSNVWKIRRIIRSFSIVHVHLFPSLYWVALASIGLHCKLVYTEHSTYNQRRSKWYFRIIEKTIYHRYSKIIAISPETKTALGEWLQNFDQIEMINNGINLDAYTPSTVSRNSNSLIMVSRFAPAKDHKTVILAMQYLPQCELSFIGDGETCPECKDLVNQLGLTNRIHFLGAIADIPSCLAHASIGIQSSHWEGFGLTAVEMMAAGLPVVASNVNGLKQVVEGAGLLFEHGNSKDLANQVSSLLSSPAHYQSISESCLLRAQRYDIENMANKYEQLYIHLPYAETI